MVGQRVYISLGLWFTLDAIQVVVFLVFCELIGIDLWVENRVDDNRNRGIHQIVNLVEVAVVKRDPRKRVREPVPELGEYYQHIFVEIVQHKSRVSPVSLSAVVKK